ncbi:tyrosine transporter [Vibrio azureus]|uniref:Tyrosine transporter n=1 Tax=Vibrio azureus NBRC 104587 TaxID=1219077 RepID=U3AAT5_9VIBR|nr:aromatic amino acid transport family protein [Vibrio azureus]AUI88460.1 tyrosine transporter [Vibrio azureus]GAD77056.1 tyrosine transporter [Vibrio azureus NBRC 104587]
MNLKLLGSSLIVAGTALGAGMLAIPMVLAQFGLLWGTLFMLFIWLGTTYAALMLLEASCRVGGGISMNAVARDTLGAPGQVITNILLYALLVCLLMAYIIGAGDVITQVASSFKFELAPYISQIAFTLLFGLIISSGTKVVDLLNRCLFIAMITALVLTLGFLAPNISFSGMGDAVNTDVFSLFQTSSVLFTSFGFMVVIPSLVSYNKDATKSQLRNMIIVGSLIPLVCYLLWLFAVIGNLPTQKLTQFNDLSELIATLGQQYSGLEFILSIFTGLALLTSFLGVAMALYDQNADLLNANKPVVFGITFILPLVGALLAHQYFLAILGYAGFILVFLAIFLPLAMMMSARSQYGNVRDVYQVGGGTVGIVLIFAFGCFLIYAQLI